MIKLLLLGLCLIGFPAHGSANEKARDQIIEYCRGDNDCLSLVTNLFTLEISISRNENITYDDFVSNPNHNEYYVALTSKGIRGSNLWKFYKEECKENFYTFLDYILN
ncbi:MAG: hypothetical protein AB8G05_19970 [Oligoflexales bacterium]